jgi:hypothetical protein
MHQYASNELKIKGCRIVDENGLVFVPIFSTAVIRSTRIFNNKNPKNPIKTNVLINTHIIFQLFLRKLVYEIYVDTFGAYPSWKWS